MIGSILSKMAGSIGKYFGGGILSTIGRYAGKIAGNYLEQQWLHRDEYHHRFTNVKDSFNIISARYGSPIPLVFGKIKIPGQIIWSGKIIEKYNRSRDTKHIRGKHLTIHRDTTNIQYYLSFAMAICEGPISELGKVWWKDQMIDISQYDFRLYKGDEEQLADILIFGATQGPPIAHRGLAYIVFDNLPLEAFGDIIPAFSFEVIRNANIKQDASVEDLVKSMVMIPGSGEYVYDTKVQKKTVHSSSDFELYDTIINSHNHYNIANSIYSLNQLQMTCQNIEWVAPVVCWFGDNVNAKDCLIKPGVEFKSHDIRYTEEWHVGKYTRDIAYEVRKDQHQNPLYGGSVNDASVVRYLLELRERKLKIMFYPMFFLDVEAKPWRGKVTCDAEYISDFFRREHGYNDFILHHAQLVKNYVDVFIIGSELIGLTKVRSGNIFPAVQELIALAEMVKKIVGPNILVSYAADWSEYHHSEGGWFNLDPLWASDAIDFVGIDAYFPATSSYSSIITQEDIVKGWMSGEGYDYYIDHTDNTKHPLDPAYAWKNLRYWWANPHRNPNGALTEWTPCSKQIWFTEFGFPSIDKSPNQPNVFFDPKSVDGGVPKYSNGITDFAIQRKSIRAFIEFWQTQEYIDQMFLWTWDARPYPAWPETKTWSDSNLWEKGHWVNNKFGSGNLASIILEISDKCGIDLEKIEVSSIDEAIAGVMFSNQITAANAINILRASHFFDIVANDRSIIYFTKRGYKSEVVVRSAECIKLTDNSFVKEIEIPKDVVLDKVNLYFLDQDNEYKTNYLYLNNESNSYAATSILKFPIVMRNADAQRIGQLMLKNSTVEDKVINFMFNTNDLTLYPSNHAVFYHAEYQYSIRIISIAMIDHITHVTGIVDHRNSYFQIPLIDRFNLVDNKSNANIELIILDLPISLQETNAPHLSMYLNSSTSESLYGSTHGDLGGASFDSKDDIKAYQWHHLDKLKPSSALGSVVKFNQSHDPNIYFMDYDSEFIICGNNLDRYNNGDWQFAMLGNELIKWQNIIKLEDDLYTIDCMTRGEMGTEEFINTHVSGERFVLIEQNANIIPVSDNLIGTHLMFKSCDIIKSIHFLNKSQAMLRPYITYHRLYRDLLSLHWIPRIKNNTHWSSSKVIDNSGMKFLITITSGNIVHKEIISNKTKITINFRHLNLSAPYKVNIMYI